VLGVGAELADGKFYAGIPFDDVTNPLISDGELQDNTKDKALTLFGTYAIPLLRTRTEGLVVTPFLEINWNQGRTRVWNMGTEASWSSKWRSVEYAVEGSAAYLDVRERPVWTLLAEPSFGVGAFSLGLGAYWAVLNGTSAAAKAQELSELDLPVELFWYVEPMIMVGRKTAFSLPVSWHNPQFDVEGDDFWMMGLAFTLWPTRDAELDSELRYVKAHGAADSWELALTGKIGF